MEKITKKYMPAYTYKIDLDKVQDLFLESKYTLQKDLAKALGITGPSLRSITEEGRAGQKALFGIARLYRKIHKERVTPTFFLHADEKPFLTSKLGRAR